MQYISFDYKEKKRQQPMIDETTLQFVWLSENIEKAATVDLNEKKWCIDREITILRIHNAGECIELACRYYAGITEDEEDIAIHLCAPEENELIGRTVRLIKADNRLVFGEIYMKEY